MNGSYVIWRRNRVTGIKDTLIERFTKFDLTLNWGEVSKFSITGKTIGEVELEPNDGVCFYRNNELLLSGIVTEMEIKCEDTASGLKEWTAYGSEDSIIFSHWVTFADPSSVTFADGLTDKQKGYAYNRLRYYVLYNMGANALANRQLSGLTVTSGQQKGQDTYSAPRFQPLDQVLQEIGDEEGNNMYARFVWNPDTGDKSVVIDEQRDMTASITIAPEFGNILDWHKRQTIPTCNAVWVVSADYESNGNDVRLYVFKKDDTSIAKYGRMEKVVIDSSVKVGTYSGKTTTQSEAEALLANKAYEELEDGAYKQKFSGTMVETPQLRFMDDWRVGDLVNCVIDGESFNTTIKTVEVEFSDNFERVKPTLGELEKGIFAKVFTGLSGLDTRMKQEELS